MIRQIVSTLRRLWAPKSRRYVIGSAGSLIVAPPTPPIPSPRLLWPYSKNPDGNMAVHGHPDLGGAFLSRYSDRLWQVFGERSEVDAFMDWAAGRIEPDFMCRRKARSCHPAVADDDYERVDIWMTDHRLAAEMTLCFGGER